jgi:hypothetical protein
MKGSQESLTTVVVKSWPTPAARDHKDTGENVDMEKVAAKSKLAGVVAVHGQAVPASSSTDGSRPGLSVDWRTPQANEAGAKVETLYTKDGQPAKPGQRAYRKTPDGRMVLQSQTINQQVEMVQNWATPRANKTEGYSSPEFRPTLHQQVTTWPTPSADGDSRPGSNADPVKWKQIADAKKAQGINKQLFLTTKVAMESSGKLNPRWVETLMGLPVGWTMPSCASPVTIERMSCASSETASSQPPQNGPSES